MKDTTLAVLEKSVSLPGAGVTRTALIVNERASDKELAELGAALVSIGGSHSWWIGDYGLFLQNRKRLEHIKQFPDADPTEIEDKGRHYMDGKAGALGLDEGNWKFCVMVCRFFKPLVRTNLSFTHHHEAMKAAGGAGGDVKKAVMWLLRAEENGWSVSMLRAQVNKSLATSKPPALEPLPNEWKPIDDADDWAKNAAVDSFTPDAAREHLTRLANIIALIEKLRELAK